MGNVLKKDEFGKSIDAGIFVKDPAITDDLPEKEHLTNKRLSKAAHIATTAAVYQSEDTSAITAIGIDCTDNKIEKFEENYVDGDKCEFTQMRYLEMDDIVNNVDNISISDTQVNRLKTAATVPISNQNGVVDHENFQPDLKGMSVEDNVSEAGPATAADTENVRNSGIFANTSDMEYFSQFGGTGMVAENLRKQSLYVKFDPLVADAADSPPALKNISPNCQVRQKNENRLSIGNRISINDADTSIGTLVSLESSKTPSPKVGSILRTADIDPEEVTKLHSLLLKQMQKEEHFIDEIKHLRSDNEVLAQKLTNAENEITKLNSTMEVAYENESKLKKELKDKIKGKQQLSMVMEEYEKTISQMVSKREEEKKEYESQIKKIEAERDSTIQHLHNLEIAFNDIHQKYERGKIVNESLKKNEEGLKKTLAEYENTIKAGENKYEMLKSHAAAQLEHAEQELELITQSYENEQAKQKVLLRKAELQISSIQDALDRKEKDNQELTSICDELIVKLSSHSNSQ